uniref:Uncharacterized protein n=1 Tax=Oryza punctata TaxID=4537 RepID=A0A0E0L7E3_ORYPU
MKVLCPKLGIMKGEGCLHWSKCMWLEKKLKQDRRAIHIVFFFKGVARGVATTAGVQVGGGVVAKLPDLNKENRLYEIVTIRGEKGLVGVFTLGKECNGEAANRGKGEVAGSGWGRWEGEGGAGRGGSDRIQGRLASGEIGVGMRRD